MPLVIDGSSPTAHVVVGDPTNTCAAFDPPDSPLLLGMWAGDSIGNALAPVVSSSPAQTWVQDGFDAEGSGTPTQPGQAAIFHAVVAGTPGSSTVTFVNWDTSASSGSILKVYVLTGHDPVAPIGATSHGRQAGGSALSASYTGSIDGGQGFLVISDWSAGATSGWTADSGCTIEDKGTVTGEISYAVVRRTSPDGLLGVSTSVGVSGLPTGGQYHWVIAEVISLEAAQAAGRSALLQQQFAQASNW